MCYTSMLHISDSRVENITHWIIAAGVRAFKSKNAEQDNASERFKCCALARMPSNYVQCGDKLGEMHNK